MMTRELLDLPMSADARLSLRNLVAQDAYRHFAMHGRSERMSWHLNQVTPNLVRRDVPSALWHLVQAGDAPKFAEFLRRFHADLTQDPEIDSLVELLSSQQLTPKERFELNLALVALWRGRGQEERELQAAEVALRIATSVADRLLLGRAYRALGKFYEPRDTDRALSCLQECCEFLRQANEPLIGRGDKSALEEYLSALQQLAWMYVLRNDPRSRSILDKAEALRWEPSLSAETVAALDQTWGEYWRRAGELLKAIEHKLRALNTYERIGDRREVLSTYNNLSMIYSAAKDFGRAIDYGERVVRMAEVMPVDPYVLTSALLNLGAAFFWTDQYEEAINCYQKGLSVSVSANLRVHVNRAHYNLAEAYYKRFQITGRFEDEQLGDAHAAIALKASPSESDVGHHEATRNLKAEILGPTEGFVHERLVPGEFAAHFDEMVEVQRQRATLAMPSAPEVHIRAHLSIAAAYLAIANKERSAAMSLIQKHGLSSRFAPELDALRESFDRDVSREERLMMLWRQSIGNLLDDDRRSALLSRLLSGESISKSLYAELCQVGLATASKHLGLLTEHGLLVQLGKGPSTRYLLSQAESDASQMPRAS